MNNQIMQNKANLLDTQVNVSSVKTKDYENEIVFSFSKNKPNQTQPVVSLPALSKPVPSAVEGVEVSNLPVVSLSNLFQTSPCKSGSSRGLFIWINPPINGKNMPILRCKDDYGI
jgi:hypothetical protein